MVRQSLFTIQFPTSAPVCQVDDFPPGTARSVEGALHVRPGGTKKVTRTELEHLRKVRPWGRLIRTIRKSVSPLPKRPALTRAAKAKEVRTAAGKTPLGGGTRGNPRRVAEGKKKG